MLLHCVKVFVSVCPLESELLKELYHSHFMFWVPSIISTRKRYWSKTFMDNCISFPGLSLQITTNVMVYKNKFISSQFWEPEIWNQGAGKAVLLSKGPMGESFLTPSSFCGSRCFLASIFTWILFLLWVFPLYIFCTDTCHWIRGLAG